MSVGNEYLRAVQKRFLTIKDLGDGTFEQLTEEDIHWTYNAQTNSIAVIVKHVCGNMVSRWTDRTGTGKRNLWIRLDPKKK